MTMLSQRGWWGSVEVCGNVVCARILGVSYKRAGAFWGVRMGWLVVTGNQLHRVSIGFRPA